MLAWLWRIARTSPHSHRLTPAAPAGKDWKSLRPQTVYSQLGRLLNHLTELDPSERVDVIMQEALSTGGLLNVMGRGPTRVILHGIEADGPCLNRACACWIAAAIDAVPLAEARAQVPPRKPKPKG